MNRFPGPGRAGSRPAALLALGACALLMASVLSASAVAPAAAR